MILPELLLHLSGHPRLERGSIGFQSGRDMGSGRRNGTASRRAAAGGEVDWIPGRAGDDRRWVVLVDLVQLFLA
ncbi:hypothetical protein DCO57_17640 [Labrenzia sp. 011]|nr:hypothetical protein DCO57_17640 [Labrenzia sp. 011]